MPTRYIPIKRTKGHTINPIRMPPSARNLFGVSFSAPRNEMNPRMIANILAAIEKKPRVLQESNTIFKISASNPINYRARNTERDP